MTELWRRMWYQILRRIPKNTNATNIFSKEWDICIVLDGCRYDLASNTAIEYDYVKNIQCIYSVDSMTGQWTHKTFNPKYSSEMSDCIYISANPYTGMILDKRSFQHLELVYEYGWSQKDGTVPPRPVTERGIDLVRKNPNSRFIIHYLQPHVPFLNWEHRKPVQKGNFGGEKVPDTWDRLRQGKVSVSDVWEGYEDNLKTVLDDLSILLTNVDADNVVVTSDHGNAIGEKGVYGHPMNMPLEVLRKVPWIEVSASDEQTFDPDKLEKSNRLDLKTQLRSLGYIR